MRSLTLNRVLPILLLVWVPLAALKSIAFAAENDGWFEVTKGMLQSSSPVSKAVVTPRDQIWVPEPGESIARIAERATGTSDHAFTIARFNGLDANKPIPHNSVLMIPGALMIPGHQQLAHGAFQPRSQIREINTEPVVPVEIFNALLSEPDEVLLPVLPVPVGTTNVDMFAGQVKVLGQVDVTRVAIGNGDIIRAEVLKSGELLVIAQSPGSTSLRLWHTDKKQSDFNIRVSEHDPETRVHMETMVRMRVRMIEFRKSALGKLGIDWSDGTAGPGFAIAGDAIGNNYFRPAAEGLAGTLPNTVRPFQSYFGIASNITSRINFLASTGDAMTLAEPVLSTTSGGSASFLAGGEIPYPSINENGQSTVQFKEYGIKLNVSPVIDPFGNVRTSVETEISQLDPAVSVQGAPGLLTRKAQTQVNVRSGETIVISGLLSSDSSKDIDKLPGIGNLPIIGHFFRARNARNSVSELVIFVTPEIVLPQGPLLNQRQQALFDVSEKRVVAARQKIKILD
ncbi:MAG: pilus assembly protein CpaC [Halioglobus sp.]|jgi:pilus assembly protein CpaC